MSPAQARRQRRELDQQRERSYRDEARARRKRLHRAELDATRGSKESRKKAKALCRELHDEAKARSKSATELARRLSADAKRARDEAKRIKAKTKREASQGCSAASAFAKGHGNASVAKARAALTEEKRDQSERKRLAKTNAEREREERRHVSRTERRGESDDEVIGNIEPHLRGLFRRVKKQIKASDRMSRTEAFLHYVEEHPGEAMQAAEKNAAAWLAKELHQQRRDAPRRSSKTLEEAPF